MARPCKCDKSLILRLHEKGLTSKSIGKIAGTTAVNVRKIVQRYGKNRGITNDMTDSNDIADSIADVIAKKVINELTKKITNELEDKVLANVIKRLNDYK